MQNSSSFDGSTSELHCEGTCCPFQYLSSPLRLILIMFLWFPFTNLSYLSQDPSPVLFSIVVNLRFSFSEDFISVYHQAIGVSIPCIYSCFLSLRALSESGVTHLFHLLLIKLQKTDAESVGSKINDGWWTAAEWMQMAAESYLSSECWSCLTI